MSGAEEKALRIGLVGSNSVALGGGETMFFRYLAQGILDLGHHPVLFNPGPPAAEFHGAELHNLNERRRMGGPFYWQERLRAPLRTLAARAGPLSPWLTTRYFLTTAKRMSRFVAHTAPCDFYIATGISAPLACRMAHIPYAILCVSMAHRTYEHVFRTRLMPASVRQRFIGQIARIEAQGLQGARQWAANSLDLRSYLQEFAGVTEAMLLWSPVDLETGNELSRAQARARLGIPADATVLATVGRMDATKGVDVFLKAAADLRDEFPELQIVLAGEGVLEGEYRRLAARLDLPARFYGYRTDVESFYRAADVVVLLFHTLGGTSHALLEAMACGAPVVTNRIYGREAIPFEDQVVYADVASPDSVREAIAGLLRDQSLLQETGRRARRYVERNHNWDQFLESLRMLAEKMTGPSQRGAAWTG